MTQFCHSDCLILYLCLSQSGQVCEECPVWKVSVVLIYPWLCVGTALDVGHFPICSYGSCYYWYNKINT